MPTATTPPSVASASRSTLAGGAVFTTETLASLRTRKPMHSPITLIAAELLLFAWAVWPLLRKDQL